MFDRILLRSGQFVLAKSKIEVDNDSFKILVEDALATYSKACPHVVDYVISLMNPRQFRFTPDFDPEMGRVPDWISECNPVQYSGISLASFYMGNNNIFGSNNRSELIDPIQAPWRYNKPVLTVPFTSKYEIKAVYKHRLTKVPCESDNVDSGGTRDWECKTITIDDTVFFKLLQAYFLMGIGRSRRAFTMNDLPILMDADAIASEGKEMEEQAKADLQDVQKFYLAMG